MRLVGMQVQFVFCFWGGGCLAPGFRAERPRVARGKGTGVEATRVLYVLSKWVDASMHA